MDCKRIFLIVIDSLGIGEMPDAAEFGDEGSNTLGAISRSKEFFVPNLTGLGLFNIDGCARTRAVTAPKAAFGRFAERSRGKDTIVGHWEIAGVISPRSQPTYPDGFPADLMERIEKATGVGALCNKPYSGTEVIHDYGREMIETGKVIVYTSADSVFQAAAHEDVMPIGKLYEYCEKARAVLCGEHEVGRVIARPFVGEYPNYTRTANRHDYALDPPGETMLDDLTKAGFAVHTVGKIADVFNRRGCTDRNPTTGNDDGLKKTEEMLEKDFTGLCFVNLVDTDSVYGHRNDVDGYARAVSRFDEWLGTFLPKLREDDLLMITADHGCDPSTPSTDHSREYIPLLVYGKKVTPVDLGTRIGFCDIGKTVLDLFGADNSIPGTSFREQLLCGETLAQAARDAMKKAYAPYSDHFVGAALLASSGKIYTGCNIENAAFSPTVCAERVALFKAVSEGEREFRALAVAGGLHGKIDALCTPCGVCRQALAEFCPDQMPVLLVKEQGYETTTLGTLLPSAFRPERLK